MCAVSLSLSLSLTHTHTHIHTKESTSELRSCRKGKVAILGSPSLKVCSVSVDVKQHWTWTGIDLGLVCFSTAVGQQYCIFINKHFDLISYPHRHTGSGNSLTNLCDDSVEGSHQHNVYSYTHTHTQSEDSVTNLCEDCVEGGHQHNGYSYTHTHTQSEDSVTNLCEDCGHQHNGYSYTHTHKVKTVSQTCVRTVVTNTMDTATHTHTKWRQCHKPVWGLCGGWSPTQCMQLHAHTDTDSQTYKVKTVSQTSVMILWRAVTNTVYTNTCTHRHTKWRLC